MPSVSSMVRPSKPGQMMLRDALTSARPVSRLDRVGAGIAIVAFPVGPVAAAGVAAVLPPVVGVVAGAAGVQATRKVTNRGMMTLFALRIGGLHDTRVCERFGYTRYW